MDEYKLVSKISKIRKGSKVAIVITHSGNGTAVGYNCSSPEGFSVELRGAFEATLEEFDGDIIKVTTATYPCLKISVQDVADVLDISKMEEMNESQKEDDLDGPL